MTQNISLQESPSEPSKEKDKSSLKTLLREAKSGAIAKNLATDVASGAPITKERLAATAIKLIKNAATLLDIPADIASPNSIDDTSSPQEVFAYLKSKFNLKTSPSIDFINHEISPSDRLKHKIQAVLTVFETDLPHQDYFVFEKVGEAFNNRIPRPDHMLPLSIGECAWTVKSINEIRTDDFSDEVCFYIAACANEYGLLVMPSVLSFCQSYLEKFTKITDLSKLIELYKSGAKSSEVELLSRQLEKLSAVDAYVAAGAKV